MSHIKSFSQFHSVNEGTWAFKSNQKADELIKTLEAIESPKEITDALIKKWYNIIGDDSVYEFLYYAMEGKPDWKHKVELAIKRIEKLKEFQDKDPIKESWRDNPDNSPNEMTVGKLIGILKKYDADQPVRMAFYDGEASSSNQEIERVVQTKEYNTSKEDYDESDSYPVIQIVGINTDLSSDE